MSYEGIRCTLTSVTVMLALTILPVAVSGRAEGTAAGAAATRYCFLANGLFSFDDIPDWNFGNDGGEISGACVTGERTIGPGRVATLSVRFIKTEAALTPELLTALSADEVKGMQTRRGDPITVKGTEFAVSKLFAPESDSNAGYFSFASTKLFGGTLLVTLFSSTRDSHDKNYQPFRAWVRTFQKPGTAPALETSH